MRSQTVYAVLRKCLWSTARRRFSSETESDKIWQEPLRNINRKKRTYSEFVEADVDWKFVERLLPLKTIPEPPKHEYYPTPSGWRPSKSAPDLPYYVARNRYHLLSLFLETRRDKLNMETMDFDAAELVVMKNIHGDIFACEKDIRKWLEKHLEHPVGTFVDEIKGVIKIKGADRAVVEKCLFEFGF